MEPTKLTIQILECCENQCKTKTDYEMDSLIEL